MFRRRYNQLYRYVGKEYLLAFLIAFLFFFFIFFINQMILLAEDILSKKVPLGDVIRLIIYSMPSIVALSFPFGSLVGALMALGRFASDNEIMAIQASGIPLRKVFYPLLVLGILFSFTSFVMNDYFLPLGTINFGKLYRELIYSNPELELEPNSIKEYQDSIIVTGEISGKNIHDIVIFDETEESGRRIITADQAYLEDTGEGQGVISLQLENVFSQSVDVKTENQFEYITSKKMIYNILLKNITFSLRNPGPREMSSYDVYQVILEKEAKLEEKKLEHRQKIKRLLYDYSQNYLFEVESVRNGITSSVLARKELQNRLSQLGKEIDKTFSDRTLQIYKLEFYKKYSIPFACMIFVVFAFPIGLLSKKSGRSVGFGLGLFVSIVYWSMLIAGQTFGLRTDFSPFLSMWLPNIIIFATGSVFLIIRLRR